MNPSLASDVYALGIAVLFYLNRDKSVRTSRALWIPVIWFWIEGSRAVSIWLGGTMSSAGNVMMEGSPIDAFVFFVLIIAGLVALARRGNRAFSVMAGNWPIIVYFLYCLMSVIWSDYPDIAIKRWFKATGDILMVLVVVTDPDPVAALRRLFSRVGFVLLPSSVLLIKYYPYLGRHYNMWSGEAVLTGVTTDKNLLGLTTYILSLGALWQVLRLLREKSVEDRRRKLVAQCALLGFGIWLLPNANSATSTSCFAVGAALMLVVHLKRISRPNAVHALVLTFVLLGGLVKVTGADEMVLQALGRNANLTGRVDIWPVVLSLAPNPLLGAGFESFWLGPRLEKVFAAFPNLHVNEAHNGYIEVYLNLGLIGVTLLILLLIHGYRCSALAFRNDPDSARLMLAFVLCAAMYSYTEAGFRMLDYAWSFLLLAIIAASHFAGPQSRVRVATTYGTVKAQIDSPPSELLSWPGVQTTSSVQNR